MVTLAALRFGVHVLRNPTIYNMLLMLRETTGVEPVLSLQGPEFVVSYRVLR